MRPWRDIFSNEAWEKVIQGTDSTAHISKFQALKAKFDAKVDTPGRKLRHLADLIRNYHAVPKTVFANINPRINHLTNIRQHAEDYLVNFKVDMVAAKKRVFEEYAIRDGVSHFDKKPIPKDPLNGHYMATNPFLQSVDRNVLTLMMRAERKACYLMELRKFYVSNGRDPKALLDLLTKPQLKTADGIGMGPGVRVEQLDPWHRPVEVQVKGGKLVENKEVGDQYAMSNEFAVWYGNIATHQVPFFLWLEDRPVCTLDDKDLVAGTMTVHYPGGSGLAAAAARYRLLLVYQHGGKLWADELKENGLTRVARTDGYTCSPGKGVTDAAAYIWTGQEILVAQHVEGGFHHSSFNGGGLVKCAGMIKMAAGKITYASNNSGHYKPGKDDNTASHFLANWKQLNDRA
jgi:hypothetical protein